MIQYTIRRIVVPLTFIFLFSQVKAESFDSAFLSVDIFQIEKDSLRVNKKYSLVTKLFEAGDYESSLKYALVILDEKPDKYIQIQINSLLAEISKKIDDKRKSIFYLKESIKLIQSFKNDFPTTIKDTLNSIYSDNLLKLGGSYQRIIDINIKNVDTAVYYYKKLQDVELLNQHIRINKAKALSNLSGIYTYYDEMRDLSLAKEYIQKAIEIAKKIEGLDGLSANYGILASIYEYENNITKAKEYYLKAINLIESVKHNSDDVLRNKEILYENYAWVLFKLKDYHAYSFLEKSYRVREELNDANLKKEIKKIEARHNIDLIKKEEENKRIKLERNNWLIAIAGILVSVFLIYLVSLYKLRQNNLRLQLSKKESESQIKIINATIDGKESERKQIAETLHDNVSALLSSANMHLHAAQKHFKGEIPIELQKTQDIILEASHKIRDLSHTLVSSVLLKFGLEYAVKDIAKKYSNSSIQIRTVIADLDRYSQDFEIKVFNIIQELLNNVLKHSKAQKAFVVIEEKDKSLHIVVKDDGKGITSEENLNSGIGLHQIKARVSMMKGDFEISSNNEQGTKVSIVIPITFKSNAKFS